MSSPISPLGTGPVAPVIDLPEQPRSPGAFQQALQDAIGNVEKLRRAADRSTQALLSGEGQELHQTVLAAQRAELAFELFLQMRNKIVQAYQEIMRMQI